MKAKCGKTIVSELAPAFAICEAASANAATDTTRLTSYAMPRAEMELRAW